MSASLPLPSGRSSRRGRVQSPWHVEVEWRAVSTGPSAVRHGAIPVSHLKVEACAKCHSEGRAATEDNRHPETLDVEADGLMFLAGGSKARFTLPARLQRVPLRSAVFWHR